MKRAIFFIFLLICFLNKFLAHKVSPEAKPNYFYFESVNLKQHIISTNAISRPGIFMLGSSGTAGSNIPEDTTTADYFNKFQNNYYAYNLASLQATIVDSVIMLNKGMNYKKPKYVILGISPDLFSDSSGSFMAMYEASNLQGLLPEDIVKNVQLERKRKLVGKTYLEIYSTNVLPNVVITAIRSKIYNFRKILYGDIMDKNIGGQKVLSMDSVLKRKDPYRLIRKLNQTCQDNNIKLIVFLEPQLWVEKFYNVNDFNRYRSEVKDLLANENIEFFDYVNLVPSDARYFHDFIHLTPEGYEILGKQLSMDFNLKINTQAVKHD